MSTGERGLPPFDDAWAEAVRRSAGLQPLSPAWAKAEIVLGLCAAVGGLKLLGSSGAACFLGGALTVCGAYLAMAGNRSHLYQSQNRQTAYLLQTLEAPRKE